MKLINETKLISKFINCERFLIDSLDVDRIISLVLALACIGIKMIVDAVRGEEEKVSDKQDLRELALLAVATSLDALAVGVTFSGYTAPAVFASSGVIGLITFVICFTGVPAGHAFGDRLGRPATVAGGCMLILIGIKIMLEGIGIL